jgi:hypothetical protein
MAFTGKATYSAGTSLPELAEDVSDLIGLISPYETPLLDVIGDPIRETRSTYHEWVEDELIANHDTINDATIIDPDGETSFDVSNGSRFRVGDQIQADGSSELMLVTDVSGNTLTVTREYAGTTAEDLVNTSLIRILGNAALEGADMPSARFKNRVRKGNYTQIFTESVEVSGSHLASSQLGLADEMDYQKLARLRELVRNLECTVINGGQAASNPQGSGSVRRTMKGIIQHLSTHAYATGDSGFPTGTSLDEAKINYVLRQIWENSNATADIILVGGLMKRAINSFLDDVRSYAAEDTKFTNMVSIYESDFGVCRILTSRWMPKDAALFLNSSRLSVLPLAGRSFHFKPLASNGDYERGEIIGEYTLELINEAAHGVIRDLS